MQEVRRPEGDPEFKSLVRALHAFLKLFHNMVEVEEGREGPPGRLAAQARKVQPAFQSARAECRLQDNTNGWLQTGLTILEQHYEGALKRVEKEIMAGPEVDWKEAWQVAIKWTRRRYRRLREQTIRRAWSLVKTLMTRRGSEKKTGEETASVGPEAEDVPEFPREPEPGTETGTGTGTAGAGGTRGTR